MGGHKPPIQSSWEPITMFHQYAPLAAFIGLILAIAGSAMFARKPTLLAVALVTIGAALAVTPYV